MVVVITAVKHRESGAWWQAATATAATVDLTLWFVLQCWCRVVGCCCALVVFPTLPSLNHQMAKQCVAHACFPVGASLGVHQHQCLSITTQHFTHAGVQVGRKVAVAAVCSSVLVLWTANDGALRLGCVMVFLHLPDMADGGVGTGGCLLESSKHWLCTVQGQTCP